MYIYIYIQPLFVSILPSPFFHRSHFHQLFVVCRTLLLLVENVIFIPKWVFYVFVENQVSKGGLRRVNSIIVQFVKIAQAI